MKKSYSFILVLILMAGLLCSCHINKVSGDGNVVSKEIPIKDYDEIQIEGETSTSNICNRMTFLSESRDRPKYHGSSGYQYR